MLNEVAVSQQNLDRLQEIKEVIDKLNSSPNDIEISFQNGKWYITSEGLQYTDTDFIVACQGAFKKVKEYNSKWLSGAKVGDNIYFCPRGILFNDIPTIGIISNIDYDNKVFEIDEDPLFTGNFVKDYSAKTIFFKTYDECAEYIASELTRKYNKSMEALKPKE